MNGLHTRQQIRQASRAASRGVPHHRRIDTVIGWIGCIGFAAFVLYDIIRRLA